MTVTLGTVSHGTMRTEDLLNTFANELEWYVGRGEAADAETSDRYRKLADEARNADPDSEAADLILDELFDALDELSPPYVYFGAHEGDGADYGFWPCFDALEEDVRCGNVLKLDDGDELPADAADYDGIMFVSDHGNVRVGHVENGRFIEDWSCV